MEYWSWILTAVGLTGFILAGRKVWWCWYINIACQGLWMTYAIVTEQFGFVVASLVYTIVFTQNAVEWTKERPREIESINEDTHDIYAWTSVWDGVKKPVFNCTKDREDFEKVLQDPENVINLKTNWNSHVIYFFGPKED